MPRFMGFVRMEEGVGTPPQALFDAMDAHIGERAAKGVFLDGGGLYGTEDAVNFVVRQGEVSRVDGPYAEAKEVVGGWAIMQYDTLEEAVADQRGVRRAAREALARGHRDLDPAPDLHGPGGARRLSSAAVGSLVAKGTVVGVLGPTGPPLSAALVGVTGLVTAHPADGGVVRGGARGAVTVLGGVRSGARITSTRRPTGRGRGVGGGVVLAGRALVGRHGGRRTRVGLQHAAGRSGWWLRRAPGVYLVLMDGWSDAEWLTLQFGSVWVVSALVGRSRLEGLEVEAFWRSVDDAPQDSPLGWQLMRAMTLNREWLLQDFQLDDRSIVSGLNEVASLLERVPPEVSRDVREGMLRVGSGLAQARGPFGQRISDQDALTLQLLAQLLETAHETAHDNPLNAASAI